MPRYEYSCPECGIVEKYRAMGTAQSMETCTSCGSPARRIFSAPLFNRASNGLTAAREKAEASAHEPAVVQRTDERAANRSGGPPNPAMERLVGREAARHLKTAPHPARTEP